jgi:hypothetical protein
MASEIKDNLPVYVLNSIMLPIVASGEAIDVNGEIFLQWKNVKPEKQGFRFVGITVSIRHTDSRDMLHETKYHLVVVHDRQDQIVANPIAPGVALSFRSTTSTSTWAAKLRARIGYPWWGKTSKSA